MRWKRPACTLLCVADHHELLADVSTAVHWDEKLSNIFLYWADLFREKYSRLCLEGEKRKRDSEREWESGEKKKRVMICITICKNPQCIRPSRTNTGFCSGSALASCSWHFPLIFFLFHWSGGPAVCLFIFENNSPSVFWFGVTRRALQRDRFRSFSSCFTCRGQLHMQESEFIP